MDPECRPSASALYMATAELSKGQPLPPFELSAEALQCRERRLAAAVLKQQKKDSKKTPLTVIPPRNTQAPALDSNSVAARRLAAKRGQPVGGPTASVGVVSNPRSTPASAESFASFADFDDAPGVNGASTSWASSELSTTDGFDPFAEHEAPIAAVTNANVTADDLFGASDVGDQSFGFSSQPTAPATGFSENGFDSGFSAFDSSAPPPSFDFSSSDVFAAAPNSSHTSTKLFDDFDSLPPSNSRSNSIRVSQHTADFFSEPDIITTTSAPSAPGTASSLFDFDAPVLAPAPTPAPVADLFGFSSEPLVPAPAPARPVNAVDLFDTDVSPAAAAGSSKSNWLGDADLLGLTLQPTKSSYTGLVGGMGSSNANFDPFVNVGGPRGPPVMNRGGPPVMGNLGGGFSGNMNGGFGGGPMGGMGGMNTGMGGGMGGGFGGMSGGVGAMNGGLGQRPQGQGVQNTRGITPISSKPLTSKDPFSNLNILPK